MEPGLVEAAPGALDDDRFALARRARRVEAAAGRLLVDVRPLHADPDDRGPGLAGARGEREAPVPDLGTGARGGLQGDDARHEVDEDQCAASGVDLHGLIVP
ncbi:hypothetical protein GCM10009830_27250 [Glycomyces endophyticus]|uniref:Uncharacterized protein n=1 Tax=Glycomyces endophyticus TaxID=480996 RepID=A0ABP4SX42_9ACTN